MSMLIPILAALSAFPAVPATAFEHRSALRSERGSTLSIAVSARIISDPARIGHGHGPPRPQMVPRPALLQSADGRPLSALVYDFE